MSSSITVKDTDPPRSATVSFVDAKGAPTQADTPPVWSTSDSSVATVEASEDGLTGTVSFGMPGVCTVDVETVDTSGTVAPAQGTVTVQSSEAVMGAVEFGEPPAVPDEPAPTEAPAEEPPV